MCRKHFIEIQKETNPQLDEVTVKALAMSGKKLRASCIIDGCTKQSQGASHSNMCRSHYLEAGGMWKGKGKKSPTPKKKKSSPKKKKEKTPARKSDGAYKIECKVEGCTKLSQGSRNGNMCRRHFSLSTKVAGDGTDGAAPDGPATEHDLGTLAAVTIAQGPKKQIRPNCAVPGCPKQSQGKANGGMCRSHFRQMQKAGVPLDAAAEPPALPNPESAAASAEAGADIPSEEEDPELNEMIAKEIERIKKRDRDDNEDHGVEDYLGGDDDDDGAAAVNTSLPGPKRGRKGAPPPSTPSEPFLRRQQARDAVDALKAELGAAVSKEISLMAAMEGMTECILCQNEPKAVAMVPCGHLAICSYCKFTENKCPICLEPIEDRAVAAV